MNSVLVSQIVISTLVLAAVYSLVNLGVVLLYATTGVVNFAQGYFMMLAAFAMTSLLGVVGWATSLVIVCGLLAALGAITYLGVMRFLVGLGEFQKVIVTLMLSIVIVQAVEMTWSPNTRALPAPTFLMLKFHDVVVRVADVGYVAFALLVVGVLVLFLNRTITGIRMRGLASNELLAIYTGMRLNYLSVIAWCLACIAAGVAGVIFAERTSVNINLPDIGLGAFPAAVIGGLKSLEGGLVGALIIASTQTMAALLFGQRLSDAIVYCLMLIFLVVRPQGLFGIPSKKRL